MFFIIFTIISYLVALLTYLEDYLSRVKPLFDVAKVCSSGNSALKTIQTDVEYHASNYPSV